jgi:hypothetical protein
LETTPGDRSKTLKEEERGFGHVPNFMRAAVLERAYDLSFVRGIPRRENPKGGSEMK